MGRREGYWKNNKPNLWKGKEKRGKKLQRCDINGYNVHNTCEYYAKEKLKKEIYEKLQEGQFGFRIERDTIDSTYALNFVVNKDLNEKRGGESLHFLRI